MEHTQIVTAADLESYAETRDSEAVIPELVYMLVNACPGLAVCRLPYGDNVNQPGMDGRVEVENGFNQFVPKKSSVWEIGTGRNPQNKATSDFKKRTEEMSAGERAVPSGYPQATSMLPRCYPGATAGLRTKRQTVDSVR